MDTRVPLLSNPRTNLRNHDDGSSRDSRALPLKRSFSMAEAMSQNQILQQPTPTGLKVRNAGKDILKHDQTCQWIKFMQNPDPLPPRNRARAQTVSNNCLISSRTTEVLPDLPQKVQRQKDSYYEDQLNNLIKKQEDLSERQQRLEEELHEQKMWQEHRLEEKVSQEDRLEENVWQEHQLEQMNYRDKVAESLHDPPVINPMRLSRSKSPVFRRRLKGSLAQFCAQRNEGCLENILYYGKRSAHSGDTTQQKPRLWSSRGNNTDNVSGAAPLRQPRYQTCSPQRKPLSEKMKGVSPATVGRRHAMAQDSGLAVSQLITQTQPNT